MFSFIIYVRFWIIYRNQDGKRRREIQEEREERERERERGEGGYREQVTIRKDNLL